MRNLLSGSGLHDLSTTQVKEGPTLNMEPVMYLANLAYRFVCILYLFGKSCWRK